MKRSMPLVLLVAGLFLILALVPAGCGDDTSSGWPGPLPGPTTSSTWPGPLPGPTSTDLSDVQSPSISQTTTVTTEGMMQISPDYTGPSIIPPTTELQ